MISTLISKRREEPRAYFVNVRSMHSLMVAVIESEMQGKLLGTLNYAVDRIIQCERRVQPCELEGVLLSIVVGQNDTKTVGLIGKLAKAMRALGQRLTASAASLLEFCASDKDVCVALLEVIDRPEGATQILAKMIWHNGKLSRLAMGVLCQTKDDQPLLPICISLTRHYGLLGDNENGEQPIPTAPIVLNHILGWLSEQLSEYCLWLMKPLRCEPETLHRSHLHKIARQLLVCARIFVTLTTCLITGAPAERLQSLLVKAYKLACMLTQRLLAQLAIVDDDILVDVYEQFLYHLPRNIYALLPALQQHEAEQRKERLEMCKIKKAKRDGGSTSSKARRETPVHLHRIDRSQPKLVYYMESLDQLAAILSEKSKCTKLVAKVCRRKARDFRIDADQLAMALAQNEDLEEGSSIAQLAQRATIAPADAQRANTSAADTGDQVDGYEKSLVTPALETLRYHPVKQVPCEVSSEATADAS